MTRSIRILSAALLIGLAMASCLAKDSAVQQQQPPSRHSLLSSKLLPHQQPKARSARSLSDMFERVKNRIFGKKQSGQSASPSSSSSSAAATSSQIQSAGSVNMAQRQPWDMSAYNQQYNPYSVLSNGNFQWPAGSSINGQLLQQPFGSLGAYPATGSVNSAFQTTQSGNAGLNLGLDAISQINGQSSQSSQPNNGQSPSSSSSQSGQGASSGLFSSASHLISQYLSPSSSSPSGAASLSSPSIGGVSAGIGNQGQIGQQGASGQQQSGQSMLTPQQQQQQTQYQEFASILDSMVAQTGASNNQRQPNINQYMQAQSTGGMQQPIQQGSMQPQQQQSQMSVYPSSQAMGGVGGSDNDMSASSNIQSYMTAATPQQASQKSSMVGLAEQLAPGAQFNKLISFPFSLSPNDDASKEGRYKLHIPFLNQHVKRSDQQASQAAAAAATQQKDQQQVQRYLNSLYSQQQQQPSYSGSSFGSQASMAQQAQPQQQQLAAQASQAVPTIVSPSQSTGASSLVSQSQSVSSAISPLSASSQQAAVAQSSSSNPSVSSSVSSSSSVSQSRPSWSVADTQSSAPSSSKLIPIQSAAVSASGSEPVSQN